MIKINLRWFLIGIILALCLKPSHQVDGGFGPWSEWDNPTCPVTCGGDNITFTRTRNCDNPPPDAGGANCTGDFEQFDVRECNNESCPVEGGFGPWSEWDNPTCPVTCGGDNVTFTRTRNCDNPTPDAGGANCTGDFEQFDVRECNNESCPVDGGLGSWSEWDNPTCPVTCGGDNITFTRSRNCDNPPPDAGGANCTGDFEQFDLRECNNESCPVDGGFGAWSEWDNPTCPVTCGGDNITFTRTRNCDNPPPDAGGANCTGDFEQFDVRECNNESCPVEGGFGPWSEWDNPTCPVTCGGDNVTFTRTRNCDNPTPDAGGANCTGDFEQFDVRECNNESCPVDGGLGSWSEWDNPTCPVTCGGDNITFTRSRNCDNPPPDAGGANCTGDFEQFDLRECNNESCPVDGGFGAWSEWDNPTCPVTCGGDNITFTRTRNCDNPPPDAGGANCTGDFEQFDVRDCNNESCPVDGGFGAWSEWDNPTCPVTCGEGNVTFMRTRVCDNPPPDFGGLNCTGDHEEFDTRECNNSPCPVDGGFGDWSPWNNPPCSMTCAGGTKTLFRSRSCDSPTPQFGGNSCVGDSFETNVTSCEDHPCPEAGEFGPWSVWSVTSCPSTCTTGASLLGTFTRTRACNNPPPQFGGQNCTGRFVQTETRECNNVSCPVNGGFGPWSEWDNQTCPVTCGGDNVTFTRTRNCDNPIPEGGGANCTGDYEEYDIRECNNVSCPVDGGFGPWSEWDNPSCPVTCGGDNVTFTRTRNCDNPTPEGGGANCTGDYEEYDIRECNNVSCQVDGDFGPWSEWDNPTCPVTCGGDNVTFTRTRICDNPPPDAGGSNCTGDNEEYDTRECNNVPCPIDGVFGPWSEWNSTDCPGFCSGDNITFTRTRDCDNPAPDYGGLNCTGDYEEIDIRECINNSCPIDGGISAWSPWVLSACGRECARGICNIQTRNRSCNNPEPQFGGRNCTETRTETENVPCTMPDLVFPGRIDLVTGGFGLWSEWGHPTCPGSCSGVNLTFTRTRKCNNPPPSFASLNCTGDYEEFNIRECINNSCPIDGGFGPWSKWSSPSCPGSCSGGNVTFIRTRNCDNPAPEFDGYNCTGDYEETDIKECINDTCPVYGGISAWGAWTERICDTCFNGVCRRLSVRKRYCIIPEPQYGGRDCSETREEVKDGNSCPLVPGMPDDGQWSAWGGWTKQQCSVTCGRGTETLTRHRECDNPPPTDSGRNCSGESNETVTRDCNNAVACSYCSSYTHFDNKTGETFYINQTDVGTTFYTTELCDVDKRPLGKITCQSSSVLGGEWGDFELNEACDFSDLPDSPISPVLKNISKGEITNENVEDVLKTAINVTVDRNLTQTDLLHLATILDKSKTVTTISQGALEDVMTIFTDVTNTGDDALFEAQERGNIANRILEAVDTVTDSLEVNPEGYTKVATETYSIEVWNLTHPNLTSLPTGLQLQSQSSSQDSTNNDTRSLFGNIDLDYAETETAIVLPYDFLRRLVQDSDGKDVRLSMHLYKKPKLFTASQNSSQHSTQYILNSKVISAKILVDGQPITDLHGSNVTMIFTPDKVVESSRNHLTACGYWNFTGYDFTGSWSTAGCSYTKTKNGRVGCTCEHLTNFAVLFDFYGQNKLDPAHALSMTIITIIGLSLSIFGLSITVFSFLTFKKLRQTRSQRTLFNLALAELCSWVVFLAGINQTQNHVGCIVVAALLHYFILASFMWMLAEAVLHYLLFVKVLGTYTSRYMLKIGIPAWGVPLLPVVILLAIDTNLYRGGEKYCWMSLTAFYYAFALPVGLIILCNTILYIIIVVNICRRPEFKGQSSQSDGSRTVLNVRVSLLCFVLLGFSWIFGFLTISDARIVFQYLFCITNSIQGFLIFVLFTARNKQVRDAWLALCCKMKKRDGTTSYLLGRSTSSNIHNSKKVTDVSGSSNEIQDNSANWYERFHNKSSSMVISRR